MKRLRKQQLLEQSIYGAIWTVIFSSPIDRRILCR